MIKLFLMIGSFVLFLSCNLEHKAIEKESYKILSVLVNEFGIPRLSPPHPDKNVPYFTARQIDTIKSKKQIIGIYPFFIIDKIKKEDLNFISDTSYFKLLDKFTLSKDISRLDVNSIKSKKEYKMVYIDSTLSKYEQYHEYNKQLFFSKALFNKDLDKAMITVSLKNSGKFLCLLEKKEQKWKIKKTHMLLIF